MKNVDEVVCANCLDIVLEPNKSKDAEYYKINSKVWCSLGCYYEKRETEALEAEIYNKTDEDNSRPKKIYKKRVKQKKRKTK